MHPQWWETLRCGCISCGSGSRSEQKAHLHSLNLIQCGCAFQARECSERQINRENASAFEGNPPMRMHSPHRFCERRQSRNQWVSKRNPPTCAFQNRSVSAVTVRLRPLRGLRSYPSFLYTCGSSIYNVLYKLLENGRKRKLAFFFQDI